MRRLLMLLPLAWCGAAAEKPGVLAIFAHPDDEQTVAPILARYAQAGHPAHLVTITSGQKGVRPHAGISAGEALAKAREQEARCACQALGIHEPFLLGFQDQGISTPPEMAQVVERLRKIIDEVKPAVVITWGPDGITGHPDHRAASNLATEAFQQRRALGWKPRKLYYVAWHESRWTKPVPPFKQMPRLVHDAFLTTEIDGKAHLEAARKSLECHKTQYTPEEMKQMFAIQSEVMDGRVYLRLALGERPAPRTRERDIFEGLR
jgi:LmbE family N-acetylglucosaminyl deacetylase